jgi:Methyltransferase domain
MDAKRVDRPASWEYYDRRAQQGTRTVRHAYQYWTGLGIEITEDEIEAEAHQVRQRLRSLTPATFVEVGAGPGTFTPDLPGTGLALDQSDAALRVLQGDLPRIPAVRADACRLPLRDLAVHRIIATHIYGILPPAQSGTFLAEAHRVSQELIVLDSGRPSGVPAEQTQRRSLGGDASFEIHRRHFDADALAEELGGHVVFSGRFYVIVKA